MVANIDLKPLTDELIDEMGYSTSDLWMVKIDSTVFGPFETESLKHYVLDNEQLFETAEASRMDENEWKPFWAHTKFQRRKPQIVAGETHEGPFWIMHAGLKVGPFSYREIDKKIEMDLLGMTDHISVDNGETWLKIYEVAGFDRRSHTPEELPIAPTEASFQKAKLQVIEKIESPHVNTSEELAELAWEGQEARKVIQFKIEEMTLRKETHQEVSSTTKWFIPTAAAVAVTVLSTGYFLSLEDEAPLVVAEAQERPIQKKVARPSMPQQNTISGRMPQPSAEPVRSYREPASVRVARPDPAKFDSPSRYPTHIETHDQYQEPLEEHSDPLDGPVLEAEQQPQEHSLVSNANQRSPDSDSLEAAMGGEPQEHPVVEEANDF